MTIWTKDNTPNGVWLPPAARGCVSLFFRYRHPSKLSPGQLMIIENHAGGINRNLAHWGYDGPIASRRQTTEEHNHAALCGRQLAAFYQSWPALINDEQKLLAEFPAIGSHFVERLRELSRLRDYRLYEVATGAELPDEQQPELSITELAPDELEVAQQTAAQLGMGQFPLFT